MSAKPFGQMSRLTQLQRLRCLALVALSPYDLGAADLELLHYGANVIYKVTRHRDGSRSVLRIHSTQTARQEIASELAWLEALNADGLRAPRGMTARGGQQVVTVGVAQVPEPRECTLLTWTEGRFARRRRTPEMLQAMGREIAHLHHHAQRFRPPRGFTRLRWDTDSLRNHPRSQLGWKRLSSGQHRVFRQVAERFETVAPHLGGSREVFGLIHGDFTFQNVLFHHGEVRVIDFDDCGFGYYLYDLATLLDRIEWREDYVKLRQALIQGYREQRSLPREHEALLTLFLLIRWTFLGLLYLSAPDDSPGRIYAPRFLRIVVPKMRKYLREI